MVSYRRLDKVRNAGEFTFLNANLQSNLLKSPEQPVKLFLRFLHIQLQHPFRKFEKMKDSGDLPYFEFFNPGFQQVFVADRRQ